MSDISFSYQNPLKEKFGDTFFKNLPQVPGVYVFLDERRRPLYVGKADNLKKRLLSYQAAKPGQVASHILEMVELAHKIRWEKHPSGTQALVRESELIRVLRPPFNIAGAYPVRWLFIGFRSVKPTRAGGPEVLPVDFRLSHTELDDGFRLYGCFPQHGKVKAGYSALLRLIYSSVCSRARFHLPAKICRSSPAYVYRGDIPRAWLGSLDAFLGGRSQELLHLITRQMLENGELPPYLYAPLQRDLVAVKEFFATGPEEVRRQLRKIEEKRTWLPQERMESLMATRLKREIRTFESF